MQQEYAFDKDMNLNLFTLKKMFKKLGKLF